MTYIIMTFLEPVGGLRSDGIQEKLIPKRINLLPGETDPVWQDREGTSGNNSNEI